MTKQASSDETDRLIELASGLEDGPITDERRYKKRQPYYDIVVLVLLLPSGGKSKPIVLTARDISIGGMRVVTRQMLYVGSRGAVQLLRSNGEVALVGVQVMHCSYIGNMEHHAGLQFIPLPRELSPNDFLDREGRIILLDPRLRQNSRSA